MKRRRERGREEGGDVRAPLQGHDERHAKERRKKILSASRHYKKILMTVLEGKIRAEYSALEIAVVRIFIPRGRLSCALV
ncbi:hypothetical protein E2C01_044342 [Portunus trituberculatus]|uniref:Uncharacterized protein n=1 Tax=Portunus trituberculatus TaxID=210409 RepID=A0A5B7FZR2_PORTR|nr:hypothetical protein [Portunus trituberculatus]